jgi:hypothetical protein
MNTESVLAVTAATTSSSQEPVAYYETTTAGVGSPSDQWQSMMSDVGKVAERFRSQLDLANSVEPEGTAASSEAFESQMSALCRLSYSSLNVSLISSAEHLLSENVRTLYQLA